MFTIVTGYPQRHIRCFGAQRTPHLHESTNACRDTQSASKIWLDALSAFGSGSPLQDIQRSQAGNAGRPHVATGPRVLGHAHDLFAICCKMRVHAFAGTHVCGTHYVPKIGAILRGLSLNHSIPQLQTSTLSHLASSAFCPVFAVLCAQVDSQSGRAEAAIPLCNLL